MIFWWSDLRFAVNGQRWADHSNSEQYDDYNNYSADTNQKPVCDDTKRKVFHTQPLSQEPSQTFYVDCHGYDTEGALIFEGLQDIDSRSQDENTRFYPTSRYTYDDPWTPQILHAADCYDFVHCPQCNMCERKIITTNTVSIVEDAFGTYIESPKAGVKGCLQLSL